MYVDVILSIRNGLSDLKLERSFWCSSAEDPEEIEPALASKWTGDMSRLAFLFGLPSNPV